MKTSAYISTFLFKKRTTASYWNCVGTHVKIITNFDLNYRSILDNVEKCRTLVNLLYKIRLVHLYTMIIEPPD